MPEYASIYSDGTKNGGDFALFRKICSSEYDNSMIKHKCKHYSAVASHYLKGTSSNETEREYTLDKARKQTGNQEIIQSKHPHLLTFYL